MPEFHFPFYSQLILLNSIAELNGEIFKFATLIWPSIYKVMREMETRRGFDNFFFFFFYLV